MIAPDQFLPLSDTATPADQDGVAEVVRQAAESRTPVYPIGGGTRLDYGVRPTQPGIGLSLKGMDRVVDHAARDLTVTVEAGATMAQLVECLASQRQRLPVDVPRADQATVGGTVATDPVGPRRHRWGTLRDYVIGIQAVDGRGIPFSAGGRVVKNAAGYNLCRLLTGSLGTLGVITQVTFMLKPIAECSALVACDLADLDVAERLLAELAHTQTVPAAVELLAGPAWADDPALATQSPASAARLLVGFEGTPAEVDWMVGQLEAQWRGWAPAAIRGDDCGRVWDRLTEFPAEAPGGDLPQVVIQISVLPSATVELVGLLLGAVPGCSIQAHAGDGIVKARLELEPSQIPRLLAERLRPAVAKAGGSLVVLSHPDGLPLTRGDVWGPAPNAAAVIEAIHFRFDPHGILNPDRFSYGKR
jgi:glycolate oxidase FAD binding subunit